MSAPAGTAQGAAGGAGSGASSAAFGAGPQHTVARAGGSGWSRGGFGVQVGSGSGVRAIPRPRRPNFTYWISPSRPRRRPYPGFQTRRAAKIARGWISMSQRADQAGQLGSSPRPTAEGPGSGRTRSPGLSPDPSVVPSPPRFSFPATTGGWCLPVETRAQRVELLGITLVPAVLPGDGNRISTYSRSCRDGGGDGPLSAPSVALKPQGSGRYSRRQSPTRRSAVKRSRPGLSMRPPQGALKQAFSWLGRWRDPSCSGQGVRAGCRPAGACLWGRVGGWAGSPQSGGLALC